MCKKIPAFLIGLALLAGCSDVPNVAVPVATAQQQAQPNVVFILVDDLGYADVGFTGGEIATPNLDDIAAKGMILDRNYVYSVCSPTRVALLTGQNPLAYGVVGPIQENVGLPLDLKLMPEYFKDMGYQTFMIGKWHLGLVTTDHWPNARGFDYFYGFLGGWIDFYTHMYGGGFDWQRNGESLREEGHATDLMTADALRVVASRDPNRPFFMYLSYNAPHSPLQYTPSDSGLNDDVEAGDRKVYAEMVTQMDQGVGELIGALRTQGMLENTIVVFSSDNGGAIRLGANNGKLRGEKGGSFEGGIRVPGFLYWEGRIEGGSRLDQPVVVHDWLPTLLEAVGGDPADVVDPYGQNMWAALGKGEQIERQVTTIATGPSRAAIDWPYKYITHKKRGQKTPPTLGLFNVVEDPYETNNLLEEMPEKAEELIAKLESIPDVRFPRNPDPLGHPEEHFRNATDDGWDYEVRVPETRPVWTELVRNAAQVRAKAKSKGD